MEGSLHILYTNWKGETRDRYLIPMHVYFGLTTWHPEPQWFMEGIDVEKNEKRIFAMRDILKIYKA